MRAPEVAPENTWKKSSYSDSQGGSCVETAAQAGQVGIRDSKDRNGPVVVVPANTWSTFVAFITR
ncbi:DUF397 domain-containing protein [Streptomyces sp. NBC_00690]|uniref:DUF397 domain-containing protein n=1 Tax=Streptomyces sp. NBC_00690 TaxID=2975808 RepID=UPI002E2A8DF1|nr:DUF397 domain-containing protein [Streptomyces sp. NBC_00690]